MIRATIHWCCQTLIPSSPARLALVAKLTDATTPVDEVVAASNDLVSLLNSGSLPTTQAAGIVAALASRGVRHEPIFQRCFWSIYKAPFSKNTSADQLLVLAEDTANAFFIMSQSGFVNDSQLLTIGLGRCIECALFLSVKGVAAAYRGIESLQRDYFSLTEVGLQDFGATADGTLHDAFTSQDTIDQSALTNQPNLVDVACSALEERMAQLTQQWSPGHGGRSPESPESLEWLSDWVCILRSVSQVGLTSAEAVRTFSSVLERWPALPMASNVITDALVASLKLHERVIDVLNHEESALFAEQRELLVSQLTRSLYEAALGDRSLPHNAALVLKIRHLFESEPHLYNKAPLLWDRIRTVKISRHDLSAARARTGVAPTARLGGGKLSTKQFAVKVKPVTTDLSEAERFVPPEFKTWRSPQHTPRGGHVGKSGAPRKARFGTRRISKNYLRDRRRGYAAT